LLIDIKFFFCGCGEIFLGLLRRDFHSSSKVLQKGYFADKVVECVTTEDHTKELIRILCAVLVALMWCSSWIRTEALVRDSLFFAVGIITLAKIGVAEDLIRFADLAGTAKLVWSVIEREGSLTTYRLEAFMCGFITGILICEDS
jgi:hypothetical protein